MPSIAVGSRPSSVGVLQARTQSRREGRQIKRANRAAFSIAGQPVIAFDGDNRAVEKLGLAPADLKAPQRLEGDFHLVD